MYATTAKCINFGYRDEVLCTGNSLDVLDDDPNCGIDDADELLDQLRELSPVGFCEDD